MLQGLRQIDIRELNGTVTENGLLHVSCNIFSEAYDFCHW